MTNREAKEYILQNWFDGAEDVKANIPIDKEYKAMKLAVEALEGCEWHYPSKGEYPTETGFYLVTLETPVGKERFVTMLNYSATLDNPTRRWIDCMGLEERRIVAWMSLPEPPKERA